MATNILNMNKEILIDPPLGYLYGFPMIMSKQEYEENKHNLKEWCISKGYPKQEADSYGKFFNIRIIGNN